MVDKEHPLQFVAIEHHPSTPLGRVHLVIAVPGKLDGRLAVTFNKSVVGLSLNVAELKEARVPCVKLEVTPHFVVNEVSVPLVHRLDEPTA